MYNNIWQRCASWPPWENTWFYVKHVANIVIIPTKVAECEVRSYLSSHETSLPSVFQWMDPVTWPAFFHCGRSAATARSAPTGNRPHRDRVRCACVVQTPWVGLFRACCCCFSSRLAASWHSITIVNDRTEQGDVNLQRSAEGGISCPPALSLSITR